MAPNQIIIIGPSDTLGKLFKIVKKGSNILARILLSQRMEATKTPTKVVKTKQIKTSYKVTNIC